MSWPPVSHKMKSFKSGEATWGLSYTYFRVFGELWKFEETGPNYTDFFQISQFYYLVMRNFKFIFYNGVDEISWVSGSVDIAIAI